jgi:DNA-binding PadR family transcriptional regulator
MSFLQPCLLLLLGREQAHGYSLLDGLEEFGFDRGQLDPSLLYRALRDMESAGWVESYWDDDSQGPRRRVYRLLPAGEDYLAQWVADLRQTRTEIDRLLKAYRQEVEPQE